MFLGHYGVGLAGRAALRGSAAQPTMQSTAPSLGTWFLAVQWLDLVWPLLLLAGIERVSIEPGPNPFLVLDFVHYPYTHSLLAAGVWAVGFGAVYRWRTGNGRAALWLGGGVLSHWVLDLLVHVPDLPLYPGSEIRLGLGLWRSVPATLVVEFGLFVLAVGFYTRSTRPLDAVGRWAWRALVTFLALGYAGSLFGPPPPSATALGLSAMVMLWLLVPWAYWIDRHRVAAA
jgi:membrane-bound metal-dependent hydrolase YbcI (DUF457 family)